VAVETIREFVTALGFSVNESQQRNFIGALEGATLRAKLLGDAIESMAKTVVDGVGQAADHLEQLFYQSSRVGSSVAGIQAFEFAFKQLGSSVGDADAALESFGYKLRSQPGFEGWVRNMGVATRDANGHLRETFRIIQELAPHIQATHNQYLSNVFRDALGGISDQGWRTLNNPDFGKQIDTALSSEAGAGIDNDAAERAAKFEQQWREVWKRIGDMSSGGYTKLLAALTDPMEKFNQWLDKNSPKINDAIGKIADSVSRMTLAWVDNLDKVKWDDVATKIDSAATSIANFAGDFTRLMSSIESKLPLLEHLIAMYIGARTGAMFGPLGAGLGAALGWIGADIAETESNPETSTVGQASTIWGNVKGWWGSHAPGWLGGGGGGGGKVSAPTGTLKQRGMDLMAFLVNERGWTPAAAAIAAGNAQQESGVNPSGPPGDSGQSWGMFQWNHERLAALKARYGDKWQTARAQYEFFADEAEKRLPEWKRAGDLSGAGYISHAYEGYGDNSTGTRVANAEQWLKAWGARGSAAVTPARPMTPTPAPTSGSSVGISPTAGFATMPSWAAGAQWDAFNQSLPVGPGSTDSSRNVNIGATTTTINVTSPDPQSAAAMVGMHLDRSANDVSRNLQGAFQ
jgi:Phage tail lysozyme